MLVLPLIGSALFGQSLKLFFHSLRERRWRPTRFVDFESFPSFHPLVAGCLCYQIADATGWSSPETAICLSFTAVIVYDTSGVKRAAGRQALLLRRIGPRQSLEHRISVFLGQSPVRAWIALVAGALVGVFIERACLALWPGHW